MFDLEMVTITEVPYNSKIYIAGPITGLADPFPQFHRMDDALKQLGFRPINPAIMSLNLEQKDYMDICLAMVRAADFILPLPGSEKSPGATMECFYARKIEIKGINWRTIPHFMTK